MKKRVLFVDNDPDFLNTRSEWLERAGFSVLRAISSEEAEKILRTEWIHLVVTDLRLRDDNDEKDISGLNLAKKPAFRTIPKIILTRFPSYEHVREAMAPSLTGLPPAVEFLAKQEGYELMVQAVKDIFAKYVKINWNLIVEWRIQHAFSELVRSIEPESDDVHLSDWADELEGLLRTLFYHNPQITINNSIIYKTGKAMLSVCAFSDDGAEEHFVVGCARKPQFQKELKRYQTLPSRVASGLGTIRVNSAETTSFGAIAYEIAGGNLEETGLLTQFYRENSAETLVQTLNHLFDHPLASLHHDRQPFEKTATLNEFFLKWLDLGVDSDAQERLEHQIEDICQKARAVGLAQITCSPYELVFHQHNSSPDSYANPLPACFKPIIIDRAVSCGTTYGQLNGTGILADRQGRTWLIEFSRMDQGPLVRDFVTLETAIKFELMSISDLDVRYEIEKRLLAVSQLEDEIETGGLEAEARKAMMMINQVRRRAAIVIGREPDIYLTGLLFCAAGHLAAYNANLWHTRGELVPYIHALLSMAMLAQRLAPPPPKGLPAQASQSLWLDETNQEAWVEGRKVELAPSEYNLLLTLYQQANQLCTREEISQQIYRISHGVETKDALNTTMTRLRSKIEPNPRHPKYIKTIRGKGYKLEMKEDR